MNGPRKHYTVQAFSPTIESVPQVLPNARIESRAFNRAHVLDAPTPLRLWHLASLDAPSVAMVWSLAFAWAAGIHLPLWIPPLLALAVWSVYVADRLLDARSALRSTQIHRLRDRHFFHWRHRRVLLPMAVAAAAAAACLIFGFMPPLVLERNSVLAAASLVYFTRVHTARKHAPFLSKELLVGLLFTAGCVLPALSRAELPRHALLWTLLVPAAVFALLAWLNCHAIDRWEAHPPSNRSAILLLAALLALAAIALAAFPSTQPRSAALLLAAALSALLIALLDRLRAHLAPLALRALADLVLLTPALLLTLK